MPYRVANEHCSTCRGSGCEEVLRNCGSCGGSGCHHSLFGGISVCDSCGGSGNLLEGRRCTSCKGAGSTKTIEYYEEPESRFPG